MSPQNKAALYRALIGAGVAAAFAAVAWASTDPKYAPFAAISGAFLTRFVAEGQYDTDRDQRLDIHTADVGSHVSPIEVRK